MNIKFTVRGQELKVITPITLVSDSIGYLNAEFAFSADWGGLDKWVHLKNSDGATYNLELKDDKVSGLNLSAGRWSVWVHGNDITPEIPTTRITTGVVAFTVSTSGVCIDGVLPYIPPTAEEQIAANAANALRQVQSLREDMDELEQAAKDSKIFANKAQLSAEAAEDSAEQAADRARSARDSADASAQSAAAAAGSAKAAEESAQDAAAHQKVVVDTAAQVGQDRQLAERAAMDADSSAKLAAESAVIAVRATTEALQQAKAEIKAEGATQVANVTAAAEEITGKVAQIDANTEGLNQLKDDLGNKQNLNTDERTNIVSAINEVNNRFLSPVAASVEDWLNKHPEATTTVQDHSLKIDKMVIGTLGYVTPQMFGAKGDGVTDDTMALTNCFMDGRLVYIPNGIYLIKKGVIVDRSNINIICESENSIIKGSSDFEEATGGMLQIIGYFGNDQATEPRRSWFYMSGGCLDGSLINASAPANGLGFCRFDNITIENLKTVGIQQKSITCQYGCKNIYINNCKLDNRSFANISMETAISDVVITNNKLSHLWGVNLYDVNNGLVSGCTINVNGTYTFLIDNCNNITVKDCLVISGHGINASNTNNLVLYNINILNTNDVGKINNCSFTINNSKGLRCDIKNSSKFNISNTTITSCGIQVDNIEDVKFENSIFDDVNIVISTPNKNVIFNGCKFKNKDKVINAISASNNLPILFNCYIDGSNRRYYEGWKPIYNGLVIGNTLITASNEINT